MINNFFKWYSLGLGATLQTLKKENFLKDTKYNAFYQLDIHIKQFCLSKQTA